MFTTTKTVTGRFFFFFWRGWGGKQDGNTLDKHTAKETAQAFNSLSKQQKIMLSKQIQNSHGSLSSRIFWLLDINSNTPKANHTSSSGPPPPPPSPHATSPLDHFHLFLHLHPPNQEHRSQGGEALSYQLLDVVLDDLMGLPRQLPLNTHTHTTCPSQTSMGGRSWASHDSKRSWRNWYYLSDSGPSHSSVHYYVICTAWCQWDFSCFYLRWMTFYQDVYLLLWQLNILWLEWLCDECTWQHKTFLVQSAYWHLAIKLYCIIILNQLKPKLLESQLISARAMTNGSAQTEHGDRMEGWLLPARLCTQPKISLGSKFCAVSTEILQIRPRFPYIYIYHTHAKR